MSIFASSAASTQINFDRKWIDKKLWAQLQVMVSLTVKFAQKKELQASCHVSTNFWHAIRLCVRSLHEKSVDCENNP